MAAPDPSAVNAYRSALDLVGVEVTIARVSGFAPNVTTLATATVRAHVSQVAPDGVSTSQAGLSGSMMGAIEQADRLVILIAADLDDQGFPLPVVKGDQITLPDSAELLNVIRLDPYKRALAGALEIYCAGIS